MLGAVVYLLELELSFREKVNLVVLEVCELDGDEESVLSLGPLDLGEQPTHLIFSTSYSLQCCG